MRYYGTVKHHTVVSQWEPLRATTLLGAKREASRRYLEAYPPTTMPGYGPLICIGVQDGQGSIEVVAVRETGHGRWMRP